MLRTGAIGTTVWKRAGRKRTPSCVADNRAEPRAVKSSGDYVDLARSAYNAHRSRLAGDRWAARATSDLFPEDKMAMKSTFPAIRSGRLPSGASPAHADRRPLAVAVHLCVAAVIVSSGCDLPERPLLKTDQGHLPHAGRESFERIGSGAVGATVGIGPTNLGNLGRILCERPTSRVTAKSRPRRLVRSDKDMSTMNWITASTRNRETPGCFSD